MIERYSESALRLIFRIVVVPAAAILRLAGVDPMGLKRRPQAQTYWKTRKGARARVDMTKAS